MGLHFSLYDDSDLSIDERVKTQCCVCGRVHLGLNVVFVLLPYSVVCTV